MDAIYTTPGKLPQSVQHKGIILEIQVQGASTDEAGSGAAEVGFRIPDTQNFGREDTVQMSPDQRATLLQMV